MKRTEALELQALGDRFEQAVYGAGRFVASAVEQRNKAYAKLRAYKAQQHGLVQNQRLLKLEYKELKAKYDTAVRELAIARGELNYAQTNDGG